MTANGLFEKDFAASIPRANRDFQLISREKRRAEGDLACVKHSGVLSPPVLEVISCDYVSVDPRLGVMAGVECFRAVCSAVRLPMHRASVSSSCWFSLRKGAIHTSG